MYYSLHSIHPESLCPAKDRHHLQGINYSYDWIEDLAPYVQPFQLMLNRYMDAQPGSIYDIPGRVETQSLLTENSIKIYPLAAGLPWRTSFQHARQSKHWRAVVKGYRNILKAFAEDKTAKQTPSLDVITVADIAMKELSRVEDGSSRFVTYMYPLADENRMRLLSEMQCLSLLFDESWEIHEHEHNQSFFLSVMPPRNNKDLSPKTPLQATLWNSIEAVYEEDNRSGGNGGRALVQFLTDYITHPTPAKQFKTLVDFMDYRFNDGGMMVCWNSAKFSIGSSLDVRGPKLRRLNRLISEQMLQSNDIASFDKEKKHWLEGHAQQFLTTNGVVIVKDLLSLPNDDAAKAICYANQMQIESQIDTHLGELLADGELNEEEYRLVTAMLYCLTGNMFSAVTMSRYGGEGARLSPNPDGHSNNSMGSGNRLKKRRVEQAC